MNTDFAALQPSRKRAWGQSAYEQMRDNFFFDKFLGKGDNAIVEHVEEITVTDKGTSSAMLHLIADLYGGGSTGDNELEGRETPLQSFWQEIQIDQIRKAVRNKGRMAEQRSVIQFRKPGRDKLGRWMAESTEEQMVLTASGISYAFNTDGSTRVAPVGEDPWTGLAYAADVKVPSANRHFRFVNASNALAAGDTTVVLATDVIKYGALVDMIAQARTQRIKPVRKGGGEYFVFMMHPLAVASLWKDADFRNAITTADVRGEDNRFFSGGKVTIDGCVIHPYVKTYNTRGAISGSKWGAGGTINGSRTLLLGAQALAFADLGVPSWDEKEFDFGNQQAIAIAKMQGLLKPQFYSPFSGTTEDFGLMVLDHAI